MRIETEFLGQTLDLKMGKLRPGESSSLSFISLDEIPIYVSIPWSTRCGNGNITPYTRDWENKRVNTH